MAAAINRVSTDSIDNIEDVKAWARDHELRADHSFDQMQAAIEDLKESTKDNSKGITRNRQMLLVASGFSGAVLTIVTLLAGVIQIIRNL